MYFKRLFPSFYDITLKKLKKLKKTNKRGIFKKMFKELKNFGSTWSSPATSITLNVLNTLVLIFRL